MQKLAPKFSACAMTLLYLYIQSFIRWKLQGQMLFTLVFEWTDPCKRAYVGHVPLGKGDYNLVIQQTLNTEARYT